MLKLSTKALRNLTFLIPAITFSTYSVRAEEAKSTSSTTTASSSNGSASSPAPSSAGASSSSKIESLIKERYLLYHQALLKANSFDELAPFRASKRKAEFEKQKEEAQAKDEEAGKKMMAGLFGMVKAMEPRNVTVTAVVVNGNSAELSVKASDAGEFSDSMTKGFGSMAKGISTALGAKTTANKPMRSTTIGKIKMEKEDGTWMVGEESWSTNVTNLTPAQEAQKKAQEAQKKSLSAWCSPAASMAFPQKPATGRIHGQAFVVENAEIASDILTIRQGRDFFADREFVIFLFGLDGKLAGQQVVVKDGAPVGKASCHVHMKWQVAGKDLPDTAMFMPSDGYGIRIAFGKLDPKTGLLPGYIVLRMPDKEQSFVQGYFYAKQK